MHNGMLLIKTRLVNTEFKKQVKQLKNSMEEGVDVTSMIKGFGKLALIIATIAVVVKTIRKAWDGLTKSNKEFASKVEAIKTALSNLLVPLVNLITPFINWLVDAVYKILSYVNVIYKSFFGVDIFAKGMKDASKSAKSIEKSLAGFDEINQLSDKSSAGGGEVDTTELKELATPTWLENIINSIKSFISEAKKLFMKLWTDVLQPIIIPFMEAMAKYWNEIVKPIIEKIGEMLTNLWNNHLKDMFMSIWDLIKTISDAIIEGVASSGAVLGPAISWLVNTFGPVIKNIFGGVIDTFGSVFGIIADTITIVTKLLKGIIDFIKNVFAGNWKKAWDGVKDTFKGVWDKIVSISKSALNLMIDAVNLMIKGINTIATPIRGLIVAMGTVLGKKWSMDNIKIPTIPKLANGGIIDVPRTGVNIGGAIAGEKGAEAVIPLTDDTLQRLANMIPITIDLTNTIDGRVLNKRLETIRANNTFATNGVI